MDAITSDPGWNGGEYASHQDVQAGEQGLVPGSELRVLQDVAGHLALFGVDPAWLPQVDRHLGELLAT